MNNNVYENYFTATVLLNKIYSVIKKKIPSLINPNVRIHYKDKYIITFCDSCIQIYKQYMDKRNDCGGYVVVTTDTIEINLNLSINDEYCNSDRYYDLPLEYLGIIKELYNLIVVNNQIIK